MRGYVQTSGGRCGRHIVRGALCGIVFSVLVGRVALAEQPVAGEPAPSEAAAGSTWSDQGLVQVPGTTDAGGVGAPLQGRYRTSIVMRRNADGSVSTQCVADPAQTAERN